MNAGNAEIAWLSLDATVALFFFIKFDRIVKVIRAIRERKSLNNFFTMESIQCIQHN